MKIDNRKRVSNESKKDSEANLLHKLIVKGRENLDFTDKLWVVLRGIKVNRHTRPVIVFGAIILMKYLIYFN